MRYVISIALWIGLFTLAGIALNLLIFAVMAVWSVPSKVYKHYKQKQMEKKMNKMKGLVIKAFVRKLANEIAVKTEERNTDIAYKSGVVGASSKHPASKKKTVKK